MPTFPDLAPSVAPPIQVQGIKKHYHIWNSPSARLGYSVLSQTHRTLRLFLSRQSAPLVALARRRDKLGNDFAALEDVSFIIERGESVGIIGRNGSGKSTLLQIIARTLRPTGGTVAVRGRVAAMLELGSGFNPDFTGRENVYLNGTILGLTKREIDARIGAIIEFADLGVFIDQPVKTYSSGMVVRLGFAVLTQIEPEILIIDEALSVGDFLFQQKCFDFIRRYKESGGTLLFVSHAMSTVMELCERALLLDSGHLAFDGPAMDAVNLYEASALRSRFQTGERPLQIVVPVKKVAVLVEASATADSAPEDTAATAAPEPLVAEVPPAPEVIAPVAVAPPPPPAPPMVIAPALGSHWSDDAAATDADAGENGSEGLGSVTSDDASLRFVRLLAAADGAERDWIVSEDEVILEVGIQCGRDLSDPHVGFKIRDRLGRVIFETSTLCMRERIGPVASGQCLVTQFRFSLPISDGEYSVTIGLANGTIGVDGYEEALLFQHGVKKFTVYKNQRAIIWSGVFNLFPQATFSRHDETGIPADPVFAKTSHD